MDIIKLSNRIEQLEERLNDYGMETKDEMLTAKDVEKVVKKNPYRVIKRLKAKYGLSYKEVIIAKSILYKEYGMKY